MRSSRRLCGLALLLGAVLFTVPGVASAQSSGTGSISGKVVDSDGKPLPYANILILGTAWGGMSTDTGTFTIKNVPVGNYSVKAMHMGYEDKLVSDVRVDRGETTTINFEVKQKVVGVMDLVEITAARERIQKTSRTGHEVRGSDAESMPIDEITELIGMKAGVVAQGGELHFRGGRGGEVQYQVDGVPVRDPLVGGGVSLAALALESADVIMGGLDAQYGNAQSGVINYKTKEGGQSFEGELLYLTDDYGQPDNTYDNLDRVFVGVGGPSPIKDLTYYISGEGTYSDTYPATIERRNHRKVLNFVSLGYRKNNSVRFQGKLAYRIGPSYKLTAEVIDNKTLNDVYYHAWSRDGYVQTFRDTTRTGEVVLRHGRWSQVPVDTHLHLLQRRRAHAELRRQVQPDEARLDPYDRRLDLLLDQAEQEQLPRRSKREEQAAMGVRRDERARLLLQLPRQRIERLLRRLAETIRNSPTGTRRS